LLQHAQKAGSFKKGVGYFLQPPGWSHDGSSKTADQLKRENAVTNMDGSALQHTGTLD
jgi:hypothetical protein